jgi:curli production assembly/transport component CsgG
MKKTLISLVLVAMLAGCATGSAIHDKITGNQFDEPVVENSKFLKKSENDIRPPQGGPIPVAVYSFQDKTGQRKYMPNVASFSTAVTQGSESYLIKALQDVGNGRWFIPLERVGLDNLIKERQMIRQMREAYQGRDAKPLPAMLFAGILMEGGIIGYDSNLLTGGSGMRVFGIGANTQYQSDTVTVNLRTVSVSTGEVLTNVTVTKTVLSYMDKVTLLRFFNTGTDSVEGEIGGSVNESINKAIDIAVQAAVVGTINEGARKGHWSFKEEGNNVERISKSIQIEAPVAIKEQPKADPVKEPAPEPVQEKTKEKPVVSTSKVYLKDLTYIYKEANDKSTKSWQLLAGTELTIVDQEGEWIRVKDGQGHSGWVVKKVVSEIPLAIIVNEPKVK